MRVLVNKIIKYNHICTPVGVDEVGGLQATFRSRRLGGPIGMQLQSKILGIIGMGMIGTI